MSLIGHPFILLSAAAAAFALFLFLVSLALGWAREIDDEERRQAQRQAEKDKRREERRQQRASEGWQRQESQPTYASWQRPTRTQHMSAKEKCV